MTHDDPTQALPGVEPTQVLPADAPDPAGETPDEAPAKAPGPLVWLASGLLVLALVAGVAWFAVATARANRENAIRQTATAYLTAIAEADADAALALLADRPDDTSLITADVLAASREAAPLTDIETGALGGEDPRPTIDVTYRLGDLPVETTLTLSGSGSTWKVDDGTADLSVPETRALTVNGATLAATTVAVLPGTYTAATTSDLVALSGEATAVVAAPDAEGAVIEVTPGLSEAGTQAVLTTVKTRFEECLASTDSRPANCPFGVSTDGVEVTEGSVRFTLNNDPWAGFAPTLDPGAMTAEGTFPYDITATATVSRDGLTTDASTKLAADRGYTVDLAVDPATVTWW